MTELEVDLGVRSKAQATQKINVSWVHVCAGGYPGRVVHPGDLSSLVQPVTRAVSMGLPVTTILSCRYGPHEKS